MKKIVTLTLSLCIVAFLSVPAFANPQLSKIDSLKAKASIESDALELADLYYEIANYYYPLDFDSSLHYATNYLNASIKAEDSVWIADAYGYIAYVYDQHGDLSLAIENFRKSLDLYIAINDPIWIAASYNNLGYVISYGLDQAGALNYFLKSMQIAESLQDSSLISDAYCNVAYFYERLKDYKTASDYYKTSLEIDIQLGDSTQIAMSYANMANISLLLGNHMEAEVLIAAAKLFESSYHLPYDIVYLYTTYVDTYLEWEKADSARKYLELSEDILDESEFAHVSAYWLCQKGYLSYLEKDYGNTLKFLDESIALYNKVGGVEALSRIYSKKAKTYAMLNMHQEAYNSTLKANEMHEALKYGEVAGILSRHEQEKLNNIKLENTKLEFALEKQRIDNSNIRYRANLKFAIIAIGMLLIVGIIIIYSLFTIRRKNKVLNARNALIKNQKDLLEQHIDTLKLNEAELKELIATKDKFFSIIAHDLKNPLSAIMGISELYITQKERLKKEDLFPVLESINETSYFGVSLLDNLLEWARSQTGVMKPKPTKLMLESIMKKMHADFSAIAKGKRIKLEFPAEASPPVFADANMVSTVMRNLIHNSIKYSHASGTIKVSTMKRDQSLVTCIEDQGIGISKKELGKLFSIDSHVRRVGTNNEQGSGLGLILCKEFIEKNNGEIWAEGEEQIGCKFSFSLPLYEENDRLN